MQVIKNLNKNLIIPDFKDVQGIDPKDLMSVLQKFSDLLLKEIFKQQLDRRKFSILNANTVYIDFTEHQHKTYHWTYTFGITEGNGGIFYQRSRTLNFDKEDIMLQHEYNGAQILWTLHFVGEEMYDLPDEILQPKAIDYINKNLS